jgi:hypothetical protein
MGSSPLSHLSALGQSVWIDNLSRESIREGHLKRLIEEDSVVGATSNPTIFQKAMSAGNAYDEQLRKETGRGSNLKETFWALAERDIKDACDLFREVWDGGAGRDGYVSLGDLPRSDPFAQGGGPSEPDGEDPRDQAGAGRDRGRDREGALDQRDADLLADALRGGRGVLRARDRAVGRGGRGSPQGGLGS